MTHSPDGLHLDTLAIGFGYDPQSAFGAAKPPVYLTSTYVYPSAEHAKKVHQAYFDGAPPPDGSNYIYSRLGHPNLDMIERRLAALDRAEDAAVFASGMAAATALALAHLRPGHVVVHTRPIYGGVDALLYGVLAGFGVKAQGIGDATSSASIAAAFEAGWAQGPVGLVMAESPANPTASVADIALLADRSREAWGRFAAEGVPRPPLVVDNTFLGPCAQTPLVHGADLTLTALTKYCGGHSDLLAGGVSGQAARVGPLKKLRMVLGSHLDPFSSWLLLRSLETLPLRTQRSAETARAVADVLAAHPKVDAITYLGAAAPDSPAGRVLERQAVGRGSTFAFDVRGGEPAAFRMLNRLKVLRLAVSLGGSETLICHPASTTHYAVPAERRQEVGISDGTVRISVGLEHPGDLIADLLQALEAA